MNLENEYQSHLIKELHRRMPDCEVLKNDPNYIQGIPDLIVIRGPHWAMLEVKRAHNAPHQPNQDYYVAEFDKRWFAAFIFPENEEEVLDAVERALQPNRKARISWSQ